MAGSYPRKAMVSILTNRLRKSGFTDSGLAELQQRLGPGFLAIIKRAIFLAKQRTPPGERVQVSASEVHEAWMDLHPGFGHSSRVSITSVIASIMASGLMGGAGFLAAPFGVCSFMIGFAMSTWLAFRQGSK